MFLWTISDFLVYGNLVGCKVKGKMGCFVCGKDIDSMWMKFCRKYVYMFYRKGFLLTYRYRIKKIWFDGKFEYGRKFRILSGYDIFNNLKNYVNNFGNGKKFGMKRKRIVIVDEEKIVEDVFSELEVEEEDEVDVEELFRWKKRLIFFELLYWEVCVIF